MAAYYPRFDVATLDASGNTVPVVSDTLDVYNVTAAASLGTVSIDADGVVAEGTLGGSAGDIVEYSHATYPKLFRQTLTATQDEAYEHADNNVAMFIADSLYASETTVYTADIWIENLDDTAQKPFKLGTGEAGATARLPYQSSLGQNLRVRLASKDPSGRFADVNLAYAPFEDVAIPSLIPTTGLTGTFLYDGFALNDSANDHKLTVRCAENLTANRTLNIIVNDASRVLDLGASLNVTGTAVLSGTNTGDTINIGTTPISSGTNGRVLFQASGVVSQDAGLSFDASTDALTIGSGALRMPNSSSVFLLATPHVSYSGSLNVFIGAGAGAGNTSFHSNVYVGDNAGGNTSVDAFFNVFVGRLAGQNTQGRENVIIGFNCGNANTAGAANVFIGSNAGAGNTTGSNNTIIGQGAGGLYNGNNAVFIGQASGAAVTSGTLNTFVGVGAGSGITTGGGHTLFGSEAGGASATGAHYSCTFVGEQAGKASTGNYNTAFGALAAGTGMTGRGNIVIGYRAAYSLTSGALNVIIGTNEGSCSNTTGSQNVFLGNGAGSLETASNRLYIANDATTTPLIYGEFPNTLLYVTAPTYRQRYDASNYLGIAVSSTGGVTFDAVGSGAAFTFSDAVTIANGGTFGQIVDDLVDISINVASGAMKMDQSGGFIFDAFNGVARIGDWNSNGNDTYIEVDDNGGLITMNGPVSVAAQNISTDTTTGTKIGTGSTQKLGFWNATPIVQPTDIGALTNSTGSTPSTRTVNDVTGAFDQTTLNENFAELLDMCNDLRTWARSTGLMA